MLQDNYKSFNPNIKKEHIEKIKKNRYFLWIIYVSLGSFYSMLEYRCEWNDKQLLKINRFFPSNKMYLKCNWIDQDLILDIREWECFKYSEIL
jgi:putative transposase